MKHNCNDPQCDGIKYGYLGDLTLCQHRSKRRALHKRHHKDSTGVVLLKVADCVIKDIRQR